MKCEKTVARTFGWLKVMLPLFVLFFVSATAHTQTASKARLVQVLYVIPKNQTAKPDANQAIAAIMTILQRHYHEQLGVTFGLKDPLVTTVTIPEDVTAAVDWNKNANLIKSRLAQDYVNNENVVVSILEGTTGDAGGSWNIVKMTGGFWNEAYQAYKQNPDTLPNKLHGWSHELGHSFGLMHTEDARACFSNNGVDLGKLPSLIMQKGADLGSVYKYPFLAQEKKLLLDPSYLPACRPLLSESGPNKAPARPHASLHLRYAQLASAPKPLLPRYIKFSHEAGYVAELTVLYHINQNLGNGVTAPMPKVEKTGNLTAGISKRIEIPNSIATNLPIIVSIRGVGITKNDVFSVNVPTNFTGELCFKAWGTIFNAQGGKCN
jgi:hypothetical protein